jgi:hypothetical protein
MLVVVVPVERSFRMGKLIEASPAVATRREGLGSHGAQASFDLRDPARLPDALKAGVREAQSIVHLAGLTGEVGHRGTGVRSERRGSCSERKPMSAVEVRPSVHVTAAVMCHPSGDLRQ